MKYFVLKIVISGKSGKWRGNRDNPEITFLIFNENYVVTLNRTFLSKYCSVNSTHPDHTALNLFRACAVQNLIISKNNFKHGMYIRCPNIDVIMVVKMLKITGI